MAAENDTSKELKTHKIYLQNSVVCLEEDWKKPFKFMKESSEQLKKIVLNEDRKEEYECEDPEPILKLIKDRIETESEQYLLKKFQYKVETVVQIEIHLSSIQKTNKRQTPQLFDVFGEIGGVQDILITTMIILIGPIVAISYNIDMVSMGKKEFETDSNDSLTEVDIYISQIFGKHFLKKEKHAQVQEIKKKVEESFQLENLLKILSEAKKNPDLASLKIEDINSNRDREELNSL